MEVRPGANPADVKNYDTDRLRHDFLIQDLFAVDEIKTIYSQIDRIPSKCFCAKLKSMSLPAIIHKITGFRSGKGKSIFLIPLIFRSFILNISI